MISAFFSTFGVVLAILVIVLLSIWGVAVIAAHGLRGIVKTVRWILCIDKKGGER